jgi:hypothetical protein
MTSAVNRTNSTIVVITTAAATTWLTVASVAVEEPRRPRTVAIASAQTTAT